MARTLLDGGALAAGLSERFGVVISGEAEAVESGQRVRFRPSDLSPTQGFSIGLVIGWRTVDVDFVPGSFAGALLKAMAASTVEQRTIFGVFVNGATNDGGRVLFRINGIHADPFVPDSWPSRWDSVELSTQKGPFVIDMADTKQLHSIALTWAGRILGAALALMPLEPAEHMEPFEGQSEGAATEVLVRRYERSPINRSACIEINGVRCVACGFDFEAVYGPAGAGFIEVHHLEMVSSLAPGTLVSPATDLVPVCSNCHAMIHRRRPPYTIAEIQAAMQTARVG